MGEEEIGPGQLYEATYGVMEDLMDKLKLLNFDSDFVRKNSLKPISRHYFAVSSNPGEQFFYFTSLAAWLLNLLGRPFDKPQEYDDPNATISNIIDELRKLNIAVDFAPAKLKSGAGEHVCYILDKLANEALRQTNFKWRFAMFPTEEMEDEDDGIVEEEELVLNKLEDDIIEGGDDDDDEDERNFLDLEDLQKSQKKSEQEELARPVEILESTIDPSDWKLEVERVQPSLKVHIRTDNKDWRAHVDQMHQHRDAINISLTEAKGQLDRLHDEIGRTLEKIQSREKFINNQLEFVLQEFRTLQDQLAETKEKYRQASGGVTERSRKLAEITEELDKIKQDMEERGTSMTDGAPLVKIKQSLTRLKTDITNMDIRIGVVRHVLLSAKMKERTDMQRDMNAPVPTLY